jgi:hypothetical protein
MGGILHAGDGDAIGCFAADQLALEMSELDARVVR